MWRNRLYRPKRPIHAVSGILCWCPEAEPSPYGGSGFAGHWRNFGGQNRSHEMPIARDNPTEYLAWTNMRRRCYSPTYTTFAYYGGRGVVVCPRWNRSFAAFLSDMGPRPSPKHSLDRIDTNGPYSAKNCRWATKDVQQQNRLNCRLTPEKVVELWRRHLAGESNAAIARAIGCGTENVWGVVTGRYWKRFVPAVARPD